MLFATLNTFILLAILLLIIAGLVYLQLKLSKCDNKWLGLIIPAIFLVISLLPLFSVAAFTNYSTVVEVVDESGELISQSALPASASATEIGEIFATLLPVFLLYNIPTLIMLAIYFYCRNMLKRKSELGRMSVQDLE